MEILIFWHVYTLTHMDDDPINDRDFDICLIMPGAMKSTSERVVTPHRMFNRSHEGGVIIHTHPKDRSRYFLDHEPG